MRAETCWSVDRRVDAKLLNGVCVHACASGMEGIRMEELVTESISTEARESATVVIVGTDRDKRERE